MKRILLKTSLIGQGIKDLSVMIIDVTNVNNPTERESFWMEKLCTYIPTGLDVREEI